MPTYEYACDACHVIFQTRHGMNEKGLSQCNQCNGSLRKVISAPPQCKKLQQSYRGEIFHHERARGIGQRARAAESLPNDLDSA